MAAPASGRVRPQIYVHFEFGVSWTQSRPPRSHAVTYMSRTMRQRSHHQRHVPPANTNFLASAQQRSVSGPERGAERGPERESQRYRAAHEQIGQRRHSRQSSRSSHERGSSAPPPFNDSPWDAEPEPLSASVLPSRQQQPYLWKELPAVPSQFRLGEDGMPWTAWSWPGGYHEEESDHEESVQYGSNVAGPSTFSPRHDGDGRQRELETLSAAMMTIDNGFEDQWWFQGPRSTVADERHVPNAPANTLDSTVATARDLGWAQASPESVDDASRMSRHSVISPLTDHVSPSSEFDDASTTYLRLSRTMTTRSEELFLPHSASTWTGPTL